MHQVKPTPADHGSTHIQINKSTIPEPQLPTSANPIHIQAAYLALTKAHSHNKKKWKAVVANIIIGVLALVKTMHEFYKEYSFNFKFGSKNIASAITTIISMIGFVVLTAVASYFHFLPYKPKVEELLNTAREHIKGGKAKYSNTEDVNTQKASTLIEDIMNVFREHDFDYTKTYIEKKLIGVEQTVNVHSAQLQKVEAALLECINKINELIPKENAIKPVLQNTVCQKCQQAVAEQEVAGNSPGV